MYILSLLQEFRQVMGFYNLKIKYPQPYFNKIVDKVVDNVDN